MYFIVLANDAPGSLERRLAHRQNHIDYWNGLTAHVKLGGAMLSGDTADATPKGSAFILEAESLAQARALLAADPFSIEKIFGDNIQIEVLRPAIGAWKPA